MPHEMSTGNPTVIALITPDQVYRGNNGFIGSPPPGTLVTTGATDSDDDAGSFVTIDSSTFPDLYGYFDPCGLFFRRVDGVIRRDALAPTNIQMRVDVRRAPAGPASDIGIGVFADTESYTLHYVSSSVTIPSTADGHWAHGGFGPDLRFNATFLDQLRAGNLTCQVHCQGGGQVLDVTMMGFSYLLEDVNTDYETSSSGGSRGWSVGRN